MCEPIDTVKLEGCPKTTCRACVTLTFNLPKGKFQMAFYTHLEEQLCQIIIKYIQNCRSYCPDKNMTFKCDLDLWPNCLEWHIHT